MRRQVIVIALAGAGILGAILVGAWGISTGWLSPHGDAKRLYKSAQRALAHSEPAQAQGHLEELLTKFPDSPWADDGVFLLGQSHEQQGRFVEGQAAYRLLLEQFPDSTLLPQAQARLGAVNVALLFSPTVTELDTVYAVKPGDTLHEIATAHRTTVEIIKRANQLEGDLIRPTQKLKIPTGRFTILIDKSQNQLLLTEDNQFIKSYPIATGSDNSTPVGTFKIVNKIVNPVWYRQGAVVPPDSPENILGTRWMGLDKQGYGIHGSVDPSGIGQHITAGCVRMTNADVEELFTIVPVGTEVTIID